jgi:hypothetical protein
MAEVLPETLGLARRLRERAGFSPEHAEDTAQAIADAFSGPVATRGAEQRSDMTRLVLTVATGQVALLLAATFSLVRLGH